MKKTHTASLMGHIRFLTKELNTRFDINRVYQGISDTERALIVQEVWFTIDADIRRLLQNHLKTENKLGISGPNYIMYSAPGARKFVKRKSARLKRRQHKKITEQALLEYAEDKYMDKEFEDYMYWEEARLMEEADAYEAFSEYLRQEAEYEDLIEDGFDDDLQDGDWFPQHTYWHEGEGVQFGEFDEL